MEKIVTLSGKKYRVFQEHKNQFPQIEEVIKEPKTYSDALFYLGANKICDLDNHVTPSPDDYEGLEKPIYSLWRLLVIVDAMHHFYKQKPLDNYFTFIIERGEIKIKQYYATKTRLRIATMKIAESIFNCPENKLLINSYFDIK